MRIKRRGSKYGALKALALSLGAVLCFIGFRVYMDEPSDKEDSLVYAMKRFSGEEDNKRTFVTGKQNLTETASGTSLNDTHNSPGAAMTKLSSFVSLPSATVATKDSDHVTKSTIDKELLESNKHKMNELFKKWNGFKNVKMPRLYDPSDPPKEMDTSKKQWTEHVYFETPTYPPSEIKYLINNENICGQEPIDVIVYVHTTPDHHAQRNIIRETWGNIKRFKKVKIRVIFLLGVSADHEEKLHDALKYEQAFYNDIIKGDFIDSYKNLTLKAIMGLKWIGTYCRQARYVLKSDDDMLINIFAMLRYLFVDHKNDKRFIACYAWPHNGMHVFRDPNSCYKWCIDKGDLVGRDTYPRYCAGAGFVMTTDVALDLYNASQRHPFFWVDDAYLTGLLPRLVPDEITYFHFDHLLTMHAPTADKAILESPVVKILVVNAHNGGGEEKRARLWKNVLEKRWPDLKQFGIE